MTMTKNCKRRRVKSENKSLACSEEKRRNFSSEESLSEESSSKELG